VTVIANTTKTILISVDLSELRVAVLEEGRTVETYIERRGAGSIAGNIYKAKIDNILPAIDAAFVDFGAPKNGFLQVRDVVVPGLSATARRRKKISDMLSNGQDILVQIEKNPMKTKGARVTMELSIAGRFLVLTPDGEGSGVSKRLPDGERERLRKLVKQLETDGVGVIARTAAAGATLEDLERDLRFLRKIWAQVQARAKTAPTKTMVHQDGDLSLRVIRDLLTRNVDKVVVDSERQYRRILGWVRTTQPEFADRIELHTGSQPLFEQYGVEAAIRSTLNRRVDLPSGGYLLFDYAEAFTVIDVNSGSSTRQSHLEETTLRTNVEAAREVLRQLRLRDIGGIIVIDFIDLERERNRKELLAVLTEELTKDRTKTYLVDISPLGLVEMTRQNTTEGVRETLTSICPTCGGEGRVLSQDTMAVEAERKLRKLAHGSSSEAFRIRLNAKVAAKLAGPGGVKLLELERETGRFFTLEGEMRMPLEEVDVVEEGTRLEVDGADMPVKEGDETKLRIDEPHMFNLSDGVARLNGYQVIVGGAISYVGQEHRVRIDRATRTIAYATLLDAKPAPIELPPEPGEFELPDFDREVGERLELEERTRGRRRRTATTTATSGTRRKAGATEDAADEEAASAPEVVEAGAEDEDTDAEAKPKRRRSRGGRTRTKAVAAETVTGEAAETQDAPAASDAIAENGDSEPAADGEAKPKRRRGTRGGRSRTRKPAAGTAAEAAAADAPDAALLEPPTEVPAVNGEVGEPDAAEKPKPARKPRARKPRPTAAEPPPGADADAATEAPEPSPSEPVAARAAAVAAPSARPEPAAEPPQPAATPETASDGDGARKKGLFGRLLGE
ncbi:MAG TPA: Rne/Rng family ribonuclease, partial [Gaiellales bacterium]|nr:Rne/Rng family ribonuclease [Gaiellales bacterium]